MTSDQQMIDAYLDEIGAALPGSRRAREDVLAELRDGLLDAAGTYRCAGQPVSAAAQAAISEFGSPRQVAAAFRPELTITHARRTALSFLASVPLIGLLWMVAAMSSDFGARPAPPWLWPGLTSGSQLAVHLAAAAILLAVLTAVSTIASTGHLTRWIPACPWTAATAAAVASLAAAAADLAIVITLITQAISAPGALDPVPVALAATASLGRLTVSRRAARRCLTARAALA